MREELLSSWVLQTGFVGLISCEKNVWNPLSNSSHISSAWINISLMPIATQSFAGNGCLVCHCRSLSLSSTRLSKDRNCLSKVDREHLLRQVRAWKTMYNLDSSVLVGGEREHFVLPSYSAKELVTRKQTCREKKLERKLA
ncbi:hypothetical protein Tco_0347391 [Tanacetum coccineum]